MDTQVKAHPMVRWLDRMLVPGHHSVSGWKVGLKFNAM